jgi:hypothetical protein
MSVLVALEEVLQSKVCGSVLFSPESHLISTSLALVLIGLGATLSEFGTAFLVMKCREISPINVFR